MSRGNSVSKNWTSAKPHPAPAKEKYCRARANGAGPSAAYRAHVAGADTKATSIKSAAHHLDRHPAIAARISYLRREQADRLEVPEELTGRQIRDLMEEVSEALFTAHSVAEGSTASESDLSKIRRIWTTHLGRLDEGTTPEKKQNTPALTLHYDRIYWCGCAKTT